VVTAEAPDRGHAGLPTGFINIALRTRSPYPFVLSSAVENNEAVHAYPWISEIRQCPAVFGAWLSEYSPTRYVSAGLEEKLETKRDSRLADSTMNSSGASI